MAKTKKTIQQQIDEMEAKLKLLKEKQNEQVLDSTSPGMDQVLAAIDHAVKENQCKIIDVLRSVSKIRRQGLTITAATRKKRTPGVENVEAEPSKGKPAAPRKAK